MKNQTVGYLILGIAIVIGFITFSFNRALTDIVNASCEHGPACPMWGTIEFQTNVSLGIIAFVILIALYLIIFSKEEKELQVKPRKIEKKNFQKILDTLDKDEKLVFEKIIDEQGTIFQSDLVEKTNFTKVKVTRILDKLEGRGIIERKRRGMTNIVILKNG